jgi:hypothetical protein
VKHIPSLVAAILLAALSFAQQPTGNSTVVFYRESHFYGSALKPSVYLDGKALTRLKNGRYFSQEVSPGKHELSSSMKGAPLPVDLKEGETLYVQLIIQNGSWRGGGRLVPVPIDDGKVALEKLKPTEKED